MKAASTLPHEFSPAHCRQPQVRMDAGPGHWLRDRIAQCWHQCWLRWHAQPLWWLQHQRKAEELQLWHREKGLIRTWSGAHGHLLLKQSSLLPLTKTGKRRALQQHQVAHLLMTAAATELMLRRLRKGEFESGEG